MNEDRREKIKVIAQKTQAIRDANAQVELSMILLEETIERTRNFIEGFFSLRKINGLMREYNAYKEGYFIVQSEEEMFMMLDTTLQNLRNIAATIMTEVERLDN